MKKTIEQWAKEKRTEAWALAAARALRGWATGQEVYEDDYDAAIGEAANIEMR